MSKANRVKKKNHISGESVALAFVGVGLFWAYLMPELFGVATPYISAPFILFGFAGFMTEMQKRFKGSEFRWDNGGVGLLLAVIAGWLLSVVYTGLGGFWRGLVCLLLSVMLLFGVAAILDFIVSIFEYFVRRRHGVANRLTGLLKFVALMASTAAAVYATLSQII